VVPSSNITLLDPSSFLTSTEAGVPKDLRKSLLPMAVRNWDLLSAGIAD
jgi:hypothetical protein